MVIFTLKFLQKQSNFQSNFPKFRGKSTYLPLFFRAPFLSRSYFMYMFSIVVILQSLPAMKNDGFRERAQKGLLNYYTPVRTVTRILKGAIVLASFNYIHCSQSGPEHFVPKHNFIHFPASGLLGGTESTLCQSGGFLVPFNKI